MKKPLKKNRTGSGLPTLEKVAELAGVSPSTISRAMNHPEVVKERTRQKIFAAIDEIGYVPNSAARTLASHRSRMIGAVFPSLETSLFGGMLESLQATVAKSGYTVIVASSGYDRDSEAEHVRTLLANGVDALVLVGAKRSQRVYDMIRAKGIPYVLTWVYRNDNRHVYVGFDNDRAAATLASYLLELGHHRIAMISGIVRDNDRAEARMRGVRRTLRKGGAPLEEDYFVEADFGVIQGCEAFRRLMQLPRPPTAIICGAELFAYGCFSESQRMGIDIPGRVSVVGIDNMEFAAALNPSLTTIETPRHEMGRVAGVHLLDLLAGRETRPRYKLETRLVARDSARAPRRR